MTNNKIQHCLAELSRATAPGMWVTPLAQDCNRLLSALCGPDGAIAIADAAAAELIASECRQAEFGGQPYYSTRRPAPTLALDDEDSAIEADVSRALRYLGARGLLEARHPDGQYVRILVEPWS